MQKLIFIVNPRWRRCPTRITTWCTKITPPFALIGRFLPKKTKGLSEDDRALRKNNRALNKTTGRCALLFRPSENPVSPAVVAGVGVDAVGFSAQVPVSTISGFSFPMVFFLGCGRTIQFLWPGSSCHLSIPLLAAESGGQDFGPCQENQLHPLYFRVTLVEGITRVIYLKNCLNYFRDRQTTCRQKSKKAMSFTPHVHSLCIQIYPSATLVWFPRRINLANGTSFRIFKSCSISDSIPKKEFSTQYMKDDIITRTMAQQGSLISNGKVQHQEGLKDYPSDMLSNSTFQEWNGMTVVLRKCLSLSVPGKPPSFFPLSPMPWNR